VKFQIPRRHRLVVVRRDWNIVQQVNHKSPPRTFPDENSR
jgi:hypothetical protein